MKVFAAPISLSAFVAAAFLACNVTAVSAQSASSSAASSASREPGTGTGTGWNNTQSSEQGSKKVAPVKPAPHPDANPGTRIKPGSGGSSSRVGGMGIMKKEDTRPKEAPESAPSR